ncbi:MAG: outer membrane protein [Nitrospiraceae bacterium]
METKVPITTGLFVAWVLIETFVMSSPTAAEWYVAGEGGVNFADRLTNVEGTGGQAGLQGPDFDLTDSISFGGKLGYFPQHGWVGIEGEVFHSTPHIKSLDNDPGIHMRVTTVGANFIVRYPGRTFQPYGGIGGGVVIAHIGDTPTVQSDTDVAGGWNVLAGLRAFVTPRVAIFTEYKYTSARLRFDGAFGTLGGFEGTYRAQHVLAGLSYHF